MPDTLQPLEPSRAKDLTRARTEPPEIFFTSARELVCWAAAVPIRRAPLRVRLQLSALNLGEQAEWTRAIERSHNDCGCSAAAVALLAMIAASGIYLLLFGFSPSVPLVLLGISLGALIAVLFGKQVGKWWSRRTLRGQVESLAARLEGKPL